MQKFAGFCDNLLFNIIFSIQIPLFMMIAGYARNYSKPIDSIQQFVIHIKKRAVSILLPWASWSLIGCFLLWKMPLADYIIKAAFQMEIAFWFLFSLFTIDVIFSSGELVSKKTGKRVPQSVIHIIVSMCGVTVLFFIGKYAVGLSFLGIKYSCYYIVFFFAGYFLFRVFHSREKYTNEIFRWAPLACFGIYGYLITRYSVFTLPDSSWYVGLRIGISLLGCMIAFFIMWQVKITRESKSKLIKVLERIGSLSLEIYVVHYFAVRLLECESYNINTIDGMFYCFVYMFFVLGITCGTIWVLSQFAITRLILFGKKRRV